MNNSKSVKVPILCLICKSTFTSRFQRLRDRKYNPGSCIVPYQFIFSLNFIHEITTLQIQNLARYLFTEMSECLRIQLAKIKLSGAAWSSG